MVTANLQCVIRTPECADPRREAWLKRARRGARILFWGWIAYWGLEILNPWWILGVIYRDGLYERFFSLVRQLSETQTWFLAPILLGAFLLANLPPAAAGNWPDYRPGL